MRLFVVVLMFVCCLFVVDRFVGAKFDNIFTCLGIFGKPGSGKTLLLTVLNYKHLKKGWDCFVDYECTLTGVQRFNDNEFKLGHWLPDGRVGFPSWYNADCFDIDDWLEMNVDIQKMHIDMGHCGTVNEYNHNICISVDEIGSVMNNRSFKTNFSPATLRWWSEHRHRRVKIYWASQGWKNPDLRIRESLTDGFYLCKRSLLRTVCTAKPITVRTDIVNVDNGDNVGGQIVDFYKFLFITQWKFCFLPKWIHKFNSFA